MLTHDQGRADIGADVFSQSDPDGNAALVLLRVRLGDNGLLVSGELILSKGEAAVLADELLAAAAAIDEMH